MSIETADHWMQKAHEWQERAEKAEAQLRAVAVSDAPSTSRNARFDRNDFQVRIEAFMIACFGREIADDVRERNHRFVEEALELVQAKGCTAAEAHMLVDYVFGRPAGDPHQEAGGVMVTLAALCNAVEISMERAGEDELHRVWTKIDVIREKQKNKPRNSPLPQASSETMPLKYTDAIVDAPRQLLAYAETPGRTLEGARDHLRLCGAKFEGCWPDWAHENGHLTKAGLAELVHRMMEAARHG